MTEHQYLVFYYDQEDYDIGGIFEDLEIAKDVARARGKDWFVIRLKQNWGIDGLDVHNIIYPDESEQKRL